MNVVSSPGTRNAPRVKRRAKSRLRPLTILGTGTSVPLRTIDNEFFQRELGIDTTPEWIESRIGIVTRHWAAHETSSDLAVAAAEAALEQASVEADDLDVVVVATSTPDYTMPSTACLVQARLGATRALAFDVVNACAGFVYGLDAASRYLQGGEFTSALVVGVDRGSRLVDPHDRRTSVFFGDGAGAMVITRRGRGRVLASKLYSRGASEPLLAPVGGAIAMDGKAVWNFATEVLPATIRELCEAANIGVDEIDLVVPHQANKNILDDAADTLCLPLDRFAINIDRYGNTLAASVPIALNEALAAGRARSGDKVALVGFGSGLAWGGILLEL